MEIVGLQDTVELMNSEDYKDRFRAEYFQLRIRADKLQAFINAYYAGKLNFKPSCSMEIHVQQLAAMRSYQAILEARAAIEKIDE